jgi:hypothetical protein
MYYLVSPQWRTDHVFLIDYTTRTGQAELYPSLEAALSCSAAISSNEHNACRNIDNAELESNNYIIRSRSPELKAESFKPFTAFKPIQHKRRHYAKKTHIETPQSQNT